MAADLATLQTRLTDAETALHNLQVGKRVQVAARDGRRLEYVSPAKSAAELTAYIADINSQIAALTGVESTDWRLNRSAGRFVF